MKKIKKEKDTAVMIVNLKKHKITRATTPYAKRYWANIERVAAEVKKWPEWKHELFIG